MWARTCRSSFTRLCVRRAYGAVPPARKASLIINEPGPLRADLRALGAAAVAVVAGGYYYWYSLRDELDERFIKDKVAALSGNVYDFTCLHAHSLRWRLLIPDIFALPPMSLAENDFGITQRAVETLAFLVKNIATRPPHDFMVGKELTRLGAASLMLEREIVRTLRYLLRYESLARIAVKHGILSVIVERAKLQVRSPTEFENCLSIFAPIIRHEKLRAEIVLSPEFLPFIQSALENPKAARLVINFINRILRDEKLRYEVNSSPKFKPYREMLEQFMVNNPQHQVTQSIKEDSYIVVVAATRPSSEELVKSFLLCASFGAGYCLARWAIYGRKFLPFRTYRLKPLICLAGVAAPYLLSPRIGLFAIVSPNDKVAPVIPQWGRSMSAQEYQRHQFLLAAATCAVQFWTWYYAKYALLPMLITNIEVWTSTHPIEFATVEALPDWSWVHDFAGNYD